MPYDEQNNLYYAEEISLDQQEDSFYINKIQKQENGYEVEIIEYIEDYTQELEQANNTIILINTSRRRDWKSTRWRRRKNTRIS